MTAASHVLPGPRSWLWDAVTAIGLILALPNMLFTAFIGGWTSVPAHRAAPMDDVTTAYSSLDVALNYLPLALVVCAAACAVIFRSRGRRRIASLLSVLQMGVFAVISLPMLHALL